MTIGASIFLIVLGAILYFATNWRISEIEIDTVGLILMIAGVAGLVLGFILRMMYRRDLRDPVYQDPDDPRLHDPRMPPR